MTFVLAREKGWSKRNLSLSLSLSLAIVAKKKKKKPHLEKRDWRHLENPRGFVLILVGENKNDKLCYLNSRWCLIIRQCLTQFDIRSYFSILFPFFRIYSGEPQIHRYNCMTGHLSRQFSSTPLQLFYSNWQKKEIGYFLCLSTSCLLIDFQR